MTASLQPLGVEVTVSDNGTMDPFVQSNSGLGSILFDTFAKSWNRVREGNATVVTFFVEDKNNR